MDTKTITTETGEKITAELVTNASSGLIKAWKISFDGEQMYSIPEGEEDRVERIMGRMADDVEGIREHLKKVRMEMAGMFFDRQNGPTDY